MGETMEDIFRSREHDFEARFAHDLELKFKIEAHRNKLFAAWASDQMGDGAVADYADTLLEYAFGRQTTDMVTRAQQDLHAAGVALADTKIVRAFEQCEAQAIKDVMEGA
jgi:hypothetical protein